ncbi:MORN repeat-containing protein 3 [Drosophila takahashii]|uniref:MORN repeat-containing protein 3 n=1 Tax=Drosophila takahashii TaxID=29030 RepID=UPI001CF8A45F|nr:MORN repeat-containing protein 3 [Drosophila takahashii]
MAPPHVTDLLLVSVIEDMSFPPRGYSSGVRCQRYTGGRYQGKWLGMQPHGYGVKQTSSGLCYEGHWQLGQRHGYGTLRRKEPDGSIQRIYVGQWQQDKRSGEGKQFYADGSVYFGQWLKGQRSGQGILWQPDGGVYVGEWLLDKMHGKGVLFTAKGNRYVGQFEGGCKSGLGVFYHGNDGQRIQRGFWSEDICRTSLMPLLPGFNSKGLF